jgi:hypothetical protein
MANDSSLLPATSAAPGQATLYTAAQTVAIAGATGPGVVTAGGGSITTTDIEFDYSAHLDRIVTALEQMSLSMAFIADKVDNLTDKITVLAEQVTRESPKVLQAVGNLNETNIIRLNGPVLIDPSGYFVQGEDIVPNTFVVAYYSEGGHYYLKINRDNSFVKVINAEPRVISNSGDAVPITLIPPVVMTASNISKIVDADSENLKIISPWEWLGISSIVKLYDEKGVDYTALKSRVDSISKST